MQNVIEAPVRTSSCTKCASQLEPGSKFCGECGQTIPATAGHAEASAHQDYTQRMPAWQPQANQPQQAVTQNFPAYQTQLSQVPQQQQLQQQQQHWPQVPGVTQTQTQPMPQVSHERAGGNLINRASGLIQHQSPFGASATGSYPQQSMDETARYPAVSPEMLATAPYPTVSAPTANYNSVERTATYPTPQAQSGYENTSSFSNSASYDQTARYPAIQATTQQVQTVTQNVPVVSDPSQKKVTYDDLAKLESYRLASIRGVDVGWAPTPSLGAKGTMPLPPSGGAPTFANVATSRKGGVSPQLVREMQSLNALLLRERIFLIMHWCIFLISNLVGFFLALQCYNGFHGDEVTRLVMALTPLTFINAVALACLAPIKGTRREIARVKERIQYVRFQMEVSHMM